MTDKIEGRMRLGLSASLLLMFITFYVVGNTLNQLPFWAVALFVIIVAGFIRSLYNNRRIVARYDNEGLKISRTTLRGEQLHERVAWHKIYGIDELRKQSSVALTGKDGEILLKVPTAWTGLERFKAAVLHYVDGQADHSPQLDFYRPRLKFGPLTPYLVTLCTLLSLSIVHTLLFPSANESLWQGLRFELVVLGIAAGFGFSLHSCRVKSLHIGQRELVLRYPLFTRRIDYQRIASVELVDDPNKPVNSKVQRLLIQLKGRSRRYTVSEFPNRVEAIYQRINQNIGSGISDHDVSNAATAGHTDEKY